MRSFLLVIPAAVAFANRALADGIAMRHRRRVRLSGALVLGLLAASGNAQTLPLPSGAGFSWERVGDVPHQGGSAMTFDAGGTLWLADDLQWLDTRGGPPGVWVVPNGPLPRPRGDAILTLGGHPQGGLPRADTVIVAIYGIRRSTDGGRTAPPIAHPTANWAFCELPSWHAHAGRLLVGNAPAFSDDRGDSWSEPRYGCDPGLCFSIKAFLTLPPPDLLPGAASGRNVAAPPNWPVGRIVAAGDDGIAVLSDDGGDSYYPATPLGRPHHGVNVALVRRPDAHPLGPGPRLLVTSYGESFSVSVWSSDDAGLMWTRRAFLTEPITGPGAPNPSGLHALPEPGEADPGASGRAVAIIGLGHLYQTTDGGETWAVVGRAPEMNPQSDTLAATFVQSTEIGPDGRLYVSVTRIGATRAWVWRTSEPFAVASSEVPPSPSSGLAVAVSPNPSLGAVVVVVSSPSASADATVEVFDALGRRVAVLHAGPLATGEQTFAVDASGWAPGVYTVRASAAGRTTAAVLTVAR